MSILHLAAAMGNESGRASLAAPSGGHCTTHVAAFLESQLETNQLENDANAIATLLSAVEDSEDRLAAIYCGIEIGSEGLTTREAHILDTQINAYNASTIPRMQINFPSNESFDGGGRLAATRMGNEAVMAKLKDAGTWIKDLILKLIDSAQAWLNSVFGGAERLKKLAEALIEKCDDVEIDDAKRKISISAAVLASGTTAPSATSIASTIAALQTSVTKLNGEAALVKDLLDAVKAGADTKADKAASLMTPKGAVGSKLKAYGEEVSPVTVDKAIGGKYINVAGGTRSTTAITEKQKKDSVEIVILPPATCKGILENVLKIAEAGIDARTKYSDKSKMADEAKKAATSIADTKDDTDVTPEQKTALTELNKALTKAAKASVLGVPQTWLAHAITVAGAAASVCDKSLK